MNSELYDELEFGEVDLGKYTKEELLELAKELRIEREYYSLAFERALSLQGIGSYKDYDEILEEAKETVYGQEQVKKDGYGGIVEKEGE